MFAWDLYGVEAEYPRIDCSRKVLTPLPVPTPFPTFDSPVSSTCRDTPVELRALIDCPVRVLIECCAMARMLQQEPRYWKPAKFSIGPGTAAGRVSGKVWSAPPFTAAADTTVLVEAGAPNSEYTERA